MNYGDIAFMLFSTALVFLMIPGLAFFMEGSSKDAMSCRL